MTKETLIQTKEAYARALGHADAMYLFAISSHNTCRVSASKDELTRVHVCR